MNISHLNFGYSNLKKVINDLSIEIPENKIISIVGGNGSGKSTLFKIISLEEKPQGGSIFFMGEDILTFNKPKKVL